MSLQIDDRTIERMLIVDDDANVRHGYEDTIMDCDVEPVSEAGPIDSLKGYVGRIVGNGVQAAVCDHHLKKHDYSVVDGAELIAELYRNNFPALLCTRWAGAQPDEIRIHRRYIPVLLGFDELEPDVIADGLHRCVSEMKGHMQPSRKSWRQLIRIEQLEKNDRRMFVVVPGWSPNQVLNLPLNMVPDDVRQPIMAGTERVYAGVNIGAEDEIELYFENWELA